MGVLAAHIADLICELLRMHEKRLLIVSVEGSLVHFVDSMLATVQLVMVR